MQHVRTLTKYLTRDILSSRTYRSMTARLIGWRHDLRKSSGFQASRALSNSTIYHLADGYTRKVHDDVRIRKRASLSDKYGESVWQSLALPEASVRCTMSASLTDIHVDVNGHAAGAAEELGKASVHLMPAACDRITRDVCTADMGICISNQRKTGVCVVTVNFFCCFKSKSISIVCVECETRRITTTLLPTETVSLLCSIVPCALTARAMEVLSQLD